MNVRLDRMSCLVVHKVYSFFFFFFFQSTLPDQSQTFTLVTKVKPECSLQDPHQLEFGDRIIQVNQTPIHTENGSKVLQCLRSLKHQQCVVCLVVRKVVAYHPTFNSAASNSSSSSSHYLRSTSEGTLSSCTASQESESLDDFRVDGQLVVGAGRYDAGVERHISLEEECRGPLSLPNSTANTNSTLLQSENPSILTTDLNNDIAELNNGYDSLSDRSTLLTVSPMRFVPPENHIYSPAPAKMKQKPFFNVFQDKSSEGGSMGGAYNGQVSPSEEKLPLKESAVKNPEKVIWSATQKVELRKNTDGKYGFHYKVKRVGV